MSGFISIVGIFNGLIVCLFVLLQACGKRFIVIFLSGQISILCSLSCRNLCIVSFNGSIQLSITGDCIILGSTTYIISVGKHLPACKSLIIGIGSTFLIRFKTINLCLSPLNIVVIKDITANLTLEIIKAVKSVIITLVIVLSIPSIAPSFRDNFLRFSQAGDSDCAIGIESISRNLYLFVIRIG